MNNLNFNVKISELNIKKLVHKPSTKYVKAIVIDCFKFFNIFTINILNSIFEN